MGDTSASSLLSGPVILGYARYLGIDPETEPTLVDVAREALSEPMPSGWERHLNEDYQMPFFFSEEIGTTWQHPLLPTYLARIEALRREHDTLRRMQFALACMRAEMAGKDAPDDASWDAAAAAAAGEVVAGRAGGVAARMVTGGVGALTDNVSRGVRRLVRMHASETLRKPTRM